MTHVSYHVNHETKLVLVCLVKQKFGHMTRFPTLSVRILVGALLESATPLLADSVNGNQGRRHCATIGGTRTI